MYFYRLRSHTRVTRHVNKWGMRNNRFRQIDISPPPHCRHLPYKGTVEQYGIYSEKAIERLVSCMRPLGIFWGGGWAQGDSPSFDHV